MSLTWFLRLQDLSKKDGYWPYFAKSSGECISTASCKLHNETGYVQNAKGTFQKLLFQTKIFFEKACYEEGRGGEQVGGWAIETDLTVLIKGKFEEMFKLSKKSNHSSATDYFYTISGQLYKYL